MDGSAAHQRRESPDAARIAAARRLITDIFCGWDERKELMPWDERQRVDCLGAIARAFSSLPAKEVDILTQFYGLDGAGKRTLAVIGAQYGVQRERPRQIKAKALRMLRHHTRSVFLLALALTPSEIAEWEARRAAQDARARARFG